MGDAPLAGVLHVHVVSSGDGSPLADASVRVGPAGAPLFEGATDAEGRVTVREPGLESMVTVAVAPPGDAHLPATWLGVNGANVTIPLPRSERRAATVEGSIAGWLEAPPPAEGHVRIALVDSTHSADAVVFASPVELAAGAEGLSHACLRTASSAEDCTWQLDAAPGRHAVFATLFDVDQSGTPDDPTDDVATVVSFARSEAIDMVAGEVQRAELMPLAGTAELSAEVPGPPEGLAGVIGVPGVRDPDDGEIMLIPFPATPARPVTMVPSREGELDDAVYWMVARASSMDGRRSSTAVSRGITSTSDPVILPPWPEPPEGALEGDRLALSGIDDSALVHVQLRSAGSTIGELLLLGGVQAIPRSELGDATSVAVTAVRAEAPSSAIALREILAGATGAGTAVLAL